MYRCMDVYRISSFLSSLILDDEVWRESDWILGLLWATGGKAKGYRIQKTKIYPLHGTLKLIFLYMLLNLACELSIETMRQPQNPTSPTRASRTPPH